ncbi:MAG: hypothetical protein ACI837_002447 [Crocinitomicaceae bacterium]|jgi:hypothetical protein
MKKNIDIKEPCTENWDQMNPTERGAFCKKCSLEVQDFTKKSAEEIRSVLALNLGGKMCGKISPSQLDTLNADFELWQMNSKRSFQSALIFSLIVAFGFTLFSCEEEREQKKIEAIQQVGNSFMESETETSYLADSTLEQTTTVEKKRNVRQMREPDLIDVEIDGVEITGEVLLEDVVVQATQKVIEVHYLGGMGYSPHFAEYLTESDKKKYDIYDHSQEEEQIEFEAFTFPNPAQERTTLRIMLPKETMVQVQLFSMSGQMIQTISMETLSKGENNLPINLLDVPNGTYLISIRSEDFKESVRFVKM